MDFSFLLMFSRRRGENWPGGQARGVTQDSVRFREGSRRDTRNERISGLDAAARPAITRLIFEKALTEGGSRLTADADDGCVGKGCAGATADSSKNAEPAMDYRK